MISTNYIGGVVKILEIPKQKILKNNIIITEFRVQFPQVTKTSIVNLILWGSLSWNLLNYYKVNDYIIIEGYLSIKSHSLCNLKIVKITVLKVYPYLLNFETKVLGK
uniref:Hypothetical chloroplast RF41 n=1 Tax=Climaconeis cf. scalaris TaxID=2846828 RepID=A0A8F8SP80_9STRA|nr:hypothetical chloroplast RF41 [Climaconeis cf. scalaris]